MQSHKDLLSSRGCDNPSVLEFNGSVLMVSILVGFHIPVKLTVLLPDPSLLGRLICCTSWQCACCSLSLSLLPFLFLYFSFSVHAKSIWTHLHFCPCGFRFIKNLPAYPGRHTALLWFLKQYASFHSIWSFGGLELTVLLAWASVDSQQSFPVVSCRWAWHGTCGMEEATTTFSLWP